MNVGDKVNWNQQHRGGYGYVTPVAAIVLGFTAQRVKVAIFNQRKRRMQEKYVRSANLSPRTKLCKLDEAYAQQKEAQPA